MRRAVFAAITLIAASLGGAAQAQTTQAPAQAPNQAWPNRPIRFVVPFPPGGPTDASARAFADGIGDSLGQPIVIENRPGAGATIASEVVLRAPPDGHTLMLLSLAGSAIHPHMRKTPYDPRKDFAPISRMTEAYFGLAIHPSVPAKTLQEFIAYAKANPGKINFGSAGAGGTTHFVGEIFNRAAGVQLYHVPYKGSAEALNDLLAGHIQVFFEGIVFPQYKAGALRVLGVTSSERRPEWPDIPAIREVVPDFELAGWYGVVATGGTPPATVAKLNAAFNAAATKPAVKDRLLALGIVARQDTPEAMAADIARQYEIFGKLVAELGMKQE